MRIRYDWHDYCSGYQCGFYRSGSRDELPKSSDAFMINTGQTKSHMVDGKIKQGRQGGGIGCLDEDWFCQVSGNCSIELSQRVIANQIFSRRQR